MIQSKKLLYFAFFIPFFLFSLNSYSQRGPGGIGNADGSDGQPELLFWLNADSTSFSDGQNVNTWIDISGNNRDFSQDNSADQPVFNSTGIGGKPAVTFNGSGSFLVDNDDYNYINNLSDFNLIAVIQSESNSTDAGFFNTGEPGDGTDADDGIEVRYDVDGYSGGGNELIKIGLNTDEGSTAYESANGTQSLSPQILSSGWSSGAAIDLFINGTADNATYNGGPTGGLTDGASQIVLGKGAMDGSNSSWYGKIAEVIFYASNLDSASRTILENYLAVKYGISIGNDKMTDNDPAYVHDIAGIGKEGDGSYDENNSAGVYISQNGNFEDDDYVMWAHDNAANDIPSIRDGIGGAESAWNRDWYVEKTGNLDVQMRFNIPEAMEGGKYPKNASNYVLLFRSNTSDNYSQVIAASSIDGSDEVVFKVSDADLQNGYYTLGTVDQTASPVEGEEGRTWYTLVPGKWSNPEIWTLDPSGALPDNPNDETPQASATDNVVILTGRTVTVYTDSLENANLTVEGRLDLQGTKGHSFSTINGTGRILLSSDHFPSGDASHFITKGEGEGTVEFYGSGFSLTTPHTFYDMEMDMSSSSESLVLASNYAINGNLTLTEGDFQINDNNTARRTLDVAGDVSLTDTAGISVGSGKAFSFQSDYGKYHESFHVFRVGGDFTNNGTVRMTNLSAPHYSEVDSTGASLVMTGTSDSKLICNNTTDLYNLVVDKGNDRTYEMEIYADGKDDFALFGQNDEDWNDADTAHPENRKALWIANGTLRLTGNVFIPSLTEGGRDFTIGERAALVLDGTNVTVHNTADDGYPVDYSEFSHGAPDGIDNGGTQQALYPFGKLQVDDGYFLLGEGEAINFRDEAPGIIEVNGGTLEANQIAISSGASSGDFAYTQTGGTVLLNAKYNYDGNNAMLNLDQPDMNFTMKGGDLYITNTISHDPNAIHINSTEGNYNVTGGTLHLDAGVNMQIRSAAPFYNVLVHNGTKATLQDSLTALGDLIIETSAELDAAGYGVAIGSDFDFKDGATYTHGTNTTNFIGDQSSNIWVRNTSNSGELIFHNLKISKEQRYDPSLYHSVDIHSGSGRSTDDHPVEIGGNLTIERGELSVNEWEVHLKGDLEITDGNILYGGSTGYVVMNNSNNPQSIIGATGDNQNFGNLKFANGNGVTFANNVDAHDVRLNDGVVDLDIYNLDISGDLSTSETYGSSRMFTTAGNSSDGGLTRYIDLSEGSSGTETIFPIGTGTSDYNPARIIQNGSISDAGKITINPVNDYHPSATDLNNTIQYYWVVDTTGFTSVNFDQLKYTFTYNSGSFPSNLNKGLNLWPDDYTWYSHNQVAKNKPDLEFPYDAYLRSDFTIGNKSEFNQPIIYYSRIPTDDYNITSMPQWSDGDTWSTDSHTGGAAGDWPQDGDIAIIGYGGADQGDGGGNRHHVAYRTGDNYDLAKVVIDASEESGVYPSRLFIEEGSTIDMGLLEGDGTLQLYLDPANQSTILGDFGSFTTNEAEGARVLFYGAGADPIEIPDIFNQLPNVRIEGNGTRTFNFPRELTVRGELLVDHNATLRLEHDLTVNGDFRIGNYLDGTLEFPNDNAHNLIVNNNLLVTGDNDSQVLIDNSTENNLEHSMQIAGDIHLYKGMGFDLFTNNSGGNNVILELFGQQDAQMTDTINMDVDLYRLEMSKQEGTDFSINSDPSDPAFTFSNFSINGPTNTSPKAIELNSGRLMLQDGGIDVTLTSGGPDFEIPSNAALFAKHGATVRTSGSNTGILLDGSIEASYNSVWQLDEGTNNYIEYTASGNASIDIYQAEFYVGSQIRRNTVTDGGVLSFTQHHPNSTVVLGTDANLGGEQSRGVLELVNDGSYFEQASGAQLTIANHVDNASAPALDMELADSEINLGEASTFIFGGDSAVAGQNLEIYANQSLKNIKISNAAGTSPIATMNTVSLTADTITINSGATFDANGLNLTINGDFYANGTFIPNQNTTWFSGSVTQHITGAPSFYNLTKDASNSLTINSDITVNNELRLLSGTFSDAGNTLKTKGDVWMEITHSHGNDGDGILFNGSEEQILRGSGIFGKLSINNINDIHVPEGNSFTIEDTLRMESGVFDIGKNLLVLKEDAVIKEENAFSNHNMIQTNISFTDAGVQKYFPEISSTETFTYPIGASGKYTPVEISIDQKDPGGSVRVKAANEKHPNIIEDEESPDPEIVDAENVLQYHWVVDAELISNFQGNMFMKYSDKDTAYTDPYNITDYITARLLSDSTNWNKYDNTSFNQSLNRLNFDIGESEPVGVAGISGDYTAGVDGLNFNGAIPDSVPIYHSDKDGDWFADSTWVEDIPGGPRGAIAIVQDSVFTSSNYMVGYETRIKKNGVVDVGTTFGHRIGTVKGAGKLRLESGSLPAGVYEQFFGPDGGTLEYAGSDDYDVLSEISYVNNLRFTGTGERRLPNLDVELYGNLEIAGTDASLNVINEHDHTLTVDSNIVFTEGSFVAGSGDNAKIIMNGSDPQTISGGFTDANADALNHLEINNSNGVTLNGPLDMKGNLTFTNGRLFTSTDNILTMTDALATVSGYNTSRYVEGPMRKNLQSDADFLFPVGSAGRYGWTKVISTNTSSSQYWEAQYYNENPHPTLDTSNYADPIQRVSANEYWRVAGPSAGASNVKIRWDDQSILPAATDDRSNLHIAEWITSTDPSEWQSKGNEIDDHGVDSGTVQTSSEVALEEHYFTLATAESVALSTAGFASSDTAICEGQSVELEVELTGDPEWEIKIFHEDTLYDTRSNISSSSETFVVSRGGTYTIDSVGDANGEGNVYGDPVEVTVASKPTVSAIEWPTPVCQYATKIYSVTDSSDYTYNWSVPTGNNSVTGTDPSTIQVEWETTGIQTLEVTVGLVDVDACSTTFSQEDITVNETPQPNIADTLPTVCYPNSIDLDASTSGTDYNYQWQLNGNNDGSDSKIYTFEPDKNPEAVSQQDTVSVSVVNNGCSDSDIQYIKVYRRPETGNQYYVPNEFDQ